MFDNIGKKIMSVASVAAWLGLISSVIVGLLVMLTLTDDSMAGLVVGLLIMIVGSISAWLSSLLLYGFGQLVYCSQVIASKVVANGRPAGSRRPAAAERTEAAPQTWKCRYCGTENPLLAYRCTKCGQYGKG